METRCRITPALARFLKTKATTKISRKWAIRCIHTYIMTNHLIDEKDKASLTMETPVRLDSVLKGLFSCNEPTVTVLELQRLLDAHFVV